MSLMNNDFDGVSTLSKLISTLKVIIDFANHFRSAEYVLITNLI